MFPRATADLLLGAALPRFSRYFPPVPPAQQLQHTPDLIIAVLMCCLAAAFLALWRAAQDFRAFRNIGIFFSTAAVGELFDYFGALTPYWSLRAITAGLLVATAGAAMQIPRRRWTLLFWPIYLFVSVAVWFPKLSFTAPWPSVVAQVLLAILIVQGLTRKDAPDKTIAVAFLCYWLVRLTVFGSFNRLITMKDYVTSVGGWQWPYPTSALTLAGIATLVIFIRDLIRDRRDKQRMAAELAAGRAVQHVLIPEDVPAIPGFIVQSVYKPFGEVGGDFFQVLPINVLPINNNPVSSGVLVIIGDVSGKGMPAAMTVSLLVGTVRTLAHYTQSPGEILAAMNERMLARSNGGFTTCLVLRADTDGVLTIANAGHIPPYVDGKELQFEGGLPLGISADAIYAESTFQLSPAQQLTLLTDGVVEARDKSGTLFGFERSASLSTQPAEAIAHAAQAFGQDDDITVLSVTRTPLTHTPLTHTPVTHTPPAGTNDHNPLVA
jgi:serine phosphatase RsbU (regulator of sigma subunit)